MKKGYKILIAAVAALLLAGWGALVIGRQYYDRKAGNFTGSFELYVYPEMTPESVLESILGTGKVRKPRSLKRSMERVGAMDGIAVGHYTVDPSCSSVYVARMLRYGWQTPVNLTLSGSIRSRGAFARKVASQVLCDSAAIASFAASPDSLARYGTDTTRLFCLIIPDTYQVFWTATPAEIFDLYAKEYDAYWTADRRRLAAQVGLTPDEVSTLASIVDGESRYAPEQPTIAGVYLNRLASGMLLQADPTVAYCYGYQLNRILKSHLDVDSPYNTYKYAGLPPGPISCPPKNCLEAVLHAERHDYYYFCADPSLNGTHRFARNYSDHLVNARAFQRALTARQQTMQK